MLDHRVLTFLTVCEELSFTRAAEKLHITQPAVSQHVRYIEDYYGSSDAYNRNRKGRWKDFRPPGAWGGL